LLEPEVIEHIKKGSDLLGQDLIDKMESNLSLFQQFCMATCFNVPPALPSTENKLSNNKASPSNVAAEKDLDAKLALLRFEIHQAVTEKARLEGEVSLLDKEIKEHGRIADHTAAFSSLLSLPSEGGSENAAPPAMAVSLAAISAAVQKLQPLLRKAQSLRGQRRPLSVVQNADVEVELKASAMVRACGELAEIQGVLQATV
jgi:hypothetical protein